MIDGFRVLDSHVHTPISSCAAKNPEFHAESMLHHATVVLLNPRGGREAFAMRAVAAKAAKAAEVTKVTKAALICPG